MRRRWNPRLHPRDRRGRFAETAGGASWATRMATQVNRQVVRRGARTSVLDRPIAGSLNARDMPEPINPTVRESLRSAKHHYYLNKAFRAELAKLRRPGDSPITLEFTGSLETTREHMEGILRCLERFPRVQLNAISYFYPEKGDENTYAHVRNSKIIVAARNPGEPLESRSLVEMEFSANWIANASRNRYTESLRQSLVPLAQLPGHSATTEPGSTTPWAQGGAGNGIDVAVHEFGHVLDFATDEKVNNDAPALLERTAALYAQRTGTQLPPSAVAESISVYAKTDGRELVAEAFTDVMFHGNNASPLSREIYRELVAAYERKYGA